MCPAAFPAATIGLLPFFLKISLVSTHGFEASAMSLISCSSEATFETETTLKSTRFAVSRIPNSHQ